MTMTEKYKNKEEIVRFIPFPKGFPQGPQISFVLFKQLMHRRVLQNTESSQQITSFTLKYPAK